MHRENIQIGSLHGSGTFEAGNAVSATKIDQERFRIDSGEPPAGWAEKVARGPQSVGLTYLAGTTIAIVPTLKYALNRVDYPFTFQAYRTLLQPVHVFCHFKQLMFSQGFFFQQFLGTIVNYFSVFFEKIPRLNVNGIYNRLYRRIYLLCCFITH